MREGGISAWRRLALAAWRKPNDPTIFGTLEVDAGPVLEFVRRKREETGVHVTVTPVVGRALALALQAHPECNVRVRLGRVVPRSSVDIFFHVVSEDGRELSGVKVVGCDRKGVVEIARELGAGARLLKKGIDPRLGRAKGMYARLPPLLLRPLLAASAFLATDLDLDLSRLGVPRDPFGSAMVTNVGVFGIDVGYAPFTPFAHVPIIVLVGQVRERPVAVEGKVAVRPVLGLHVTLDHRLIDGFQAGALASVAREYLANPW